MPSRRPAFSTVLAALALVVAMSGSAVAGGMITGHQIKNGSVTGRDVKDSSLSGVDVGDGSLTLADLSPADRASALAQTPAPVTRWALVKDDVLTQGNGVVSVVRQSAGRYLVYFDGSVANSAISANTVGFSLGEVSVTACGNSPMLPSGLTCLGTNSRSEVSVVTSNGSGTAADANFLVVVHPAGVSAGAVAP